ncbi:hypothetical protein MSAN_01908600 [Mycena sanguinolenta]|uniref:Uncharacterized protein n=1 Tax=Mycena sanguinolenta TaxID=230812 RepID=A0A8H6XP19_9AGAR|nr:hypothetical protein MSAN_01908600 [Mycena sanguinolenta]
MAGSPNTLIVLGLSPDSYFIGHDRLGYLYDAMDKYEQNNGHMVHFNGSINQDVRDYLSGTNGKFGAEFVSFPDCDNSPFQYFLKGKNEGSWHAVLNNHLSQKIAATKAEVTNFDAAITGMLFGKGETHIMMFRAGFIATFDQEISDQEHPLKKVLAQYSEPGWCIERGSTLCFYDSKYFFLKFKRPGESAIKIHWSLPPSMDTKLRQLMQKAEEPEEKTGLVHEEQMWQQVIQQRLVGQQMIMNQLQQMNMNMAASWSGFRLQ